MKRIFYILILIPVLVNSQGRSTSQKESQKGIVWTTGISWEAVKQKAQQENKYIFLDFFATWCGPCKEMEKYVYSNDTVGTFFNEKFISVKVQMDKTKNDAESVKSWYQDAAQLGQKYKVSAFPTYVFLAPDGKLTHLSKGYQPVAKFVSEAKIAVVPGQVYANKYEAFDSLLSDYQKGIKHYDRMVYMINTALELRSTETFKQLVWDYVYYLESAEQKVLYNRENIWFMSRRLGPKTLKSRPKLFDVFASYSKKVDEVMGLKGYADNILSRVIFHEIAVPTIGVKESSFLVMGFPSADTTEANWSDLYRKITAGYNKDIACRSLLDTKIAWYGSHFNYPKFADAYLEKLERFGIDTVSDRDISNVQHQIVNHNCWTIFQKVADPSLLSRAVEQMKKLIQIIPENPQYVDTYANLLYKSGKQTEAMKWQEKAIAISNEKERPNQVALYTSVLTKMRSGEPTWPVKKVKQ